MGSQLQFKTKQEPSMIHATSTTFVVSSNFRLILKNRDGRTDEWMYKRTICVNIVIITSRDCGLASWINNDSKQMLGVDQYTSLRTNSNAFIFGGWDQVQFRLCQKQYTILELCFKFDTRTEKTIS